MKKIQLIHWKAAEAEPRIEQLEAAGYEVVYEGLDGPGVLRKLRENPPSAIVIDLSRLPSHGREVALTIRMQKTTRQIPLVFVEGDLEKVARIQQILPDAVYTTWSQIRSALKRALADAPTDPVVPQSIFAGYSGTPLPKKLTIKPGSVVALVNAPRGFKALLGDLPDGVRFQKQINPQCDLVIWFTRSRLELESEVEQMADRIDRAALWIAWPKKSSSLATDLTQQQVREAGLAVGLVDYKVCAIDETWSGLLFKRRK